MGKLEIFYACVVWFCIILFNITWFLGIEEASTLYFALFAGVLQGQEEIKRKIGEASNEST